MQAEGPGSQRGFMARPGSGRWPRRQREVEKRSNQDEGRAGGDQSQGKTAKVGWISRLHSCRPSRQDARASPGPGSPVARPCLDDAVDEHASQFSKAITRTGSGLSARSGQFLERIDVAVGRHLADGLTMVIAIADQDDRAPSRVRSLRIVERIPNHQGTLRYDP